MGVVGLHTLLIVVEESLNRLRTVGPRMFQIARLNVRLHTSSALQRRPATQLPLNRHIHIYSVQQPVGHRGVPGICWTPNQAPSSGSVREQYFTLPTGMPGSSLTICPFVLEEIPCDTSCLCQRDGFLNQSSPCYTQVVGYRLLRQNQGRLQNAPSQIIIDPGCQEASGRYNHMPS